MSRTEGCQAIIFRAEDDPDLADRVLKLRKTIFVDRCGWDLPVDAQGREIDAYDGPDSIYAALIEDGELKGTFRATCSTLPYLSREIFPQLAVVMPYPERPDVWEISRFGILGDKDVTRLARINYAIMFWFAKQVGATSLVAVADLVYERFLRTLNIRTRRFGPPQTIGADRSGRALQAVAGEIPIATQDSSSVRNLFTHLESVEISDVSDVFGPTRVSA